MSEKKNSQDALLRSRLGLCGHSATVMNLAEVIQEKRSEVN